MRTFIRHTVCAVALVGATVAAAAAAGPALAVTAASQSPAATTFTDGLNAVAVSSASNAWAVGTYFHGGAYLTLTEHWNGSHWTVVKSPSPSAPHSAVEGVAVHSSQAWAVGYTSASTTRTQTLIEHWNGTAWKRVASPNPGGAGTKDFLNAVAYPSKSQAWAVGEYATSTSSTAVIDRWNGTAWKAVRSPKVPNSSLTGIAAVSPSNAWAVGDYVSGSQARTLIEHWNGTAWKVVPSPNASTTDNQLQGVSASSASNAWAVGLFNNGSTLQTLTLHWNGKVWQDVNSPDVGGGSAANALHGVTTVSADNVWAVGYDVGAGVAQCLVMHWIGGIWEVVHSASPGISANLLAVGSASRSAPWAVGAHATSEGQNTLIERRTASGWQPVASPNK